MGVSALAPSHTLSPGVMFCSFSFLRADVTGWLQHWFCLRETAAWEDSSDGDISLSLISLPPTHPPFHFLANFYSSARSLLCSVVVVISFAVLNMTDHNTEEGRQSLFSPSETFTGEKVLVTYVRSDPVQQESVSEDWATALALAKWFSCLAFPRWLYIFCNTSRRRSIGSHWQR